MRSKLLTSFFTVLLGLLFVFMPRTAFAQNQVDVFLFWGDGCPHCAREKPFLEQLEKKYSFVNLYSYEIWGNKENRELLTNVEKRLQTQVQGVPFTVVGDKQFSGYLTNETTGKEIENAIISCSEKRCPNPVGELLKGDNQDTVALEEKSDKVIPTTIDVPFIGSLDTKSVSLPLLTIVIGALDGFNPCAMWTLLFLISLLIGMHDKKRMWILGSAFIVTSALVYFLFMAAWLHLMLFIGFVFWIRTAIGLLALGAGFYNLREYLTNKDNACKVTKSEERRKVFSALKHITQEKHFLIALGGIIVLAAAVNVIELVCSAGFPVIYTQTLALSNLPVWQYYAYLLLYIFVFMLDDLFVFIVSMKTLEMTGVTTKYSRFSHLIGGILMLILGLLLLFKPELLMFG